MSAISAEISLAPTASSLEEEATCAITILRLWFLSSIPLLASITCLVICEASVKIFLSLSIMMLKERLTSPIDPFSSARLVKSPLAMVWVTLENSSKEDVSVLSTKRARG
ncbi:hypothetical protein D3C86_1970800 [compost metagenome]